MKELLSTLLGLLLILAIGILAQKRLKLSDVFYQGVNALVIRITLPALIIASMDKRFSGEMAENSIKLIVIAIVSFAAVIAGLEVWKRIAPDKHQTRGLHQYLVLVGNTAFMGYPIVQAMYGSDGVFYASVFNLVHNFVTFSYGISLLVQGRTIRWRDLLKNGCLMATFFGTALFLLPLQLPSAVHQALADVGAITIPLCLLMVGARLSQQPVRALLRPSPIWGLSLVRLVLFPILMIPLLRFAGCTGVILAVPSILFATPVALTAASFAEEYGGDADFASRAVILSNLLAVLTLPVVALLVA